MTQLTIDTHIESSAAAIALAAQAECAFKELSDALGGLLRDGTSVTIVEQQFDTAVSLLIQQLRICNPEAAGDQVSGWLRLVSLQHPEAFAAPPFHEKVLTPILDRWQALLTDGATHISLSAVDALIGQMTKTLGQRRGKKVRALFVGDCLVWDIATQIQILAHGRDFDIEPTVVAKRVGPDLRRSLRAFRPDQFDLIFYSPFSFGFSEEYAQYTTLGRMLSAVAKGVAPLKEALEETSKSITLIHKYFDSPLYIHNVSGVRQNRAGFSGWVGNLVSWPVRHWAATYLDARLSAFINGLAAADGKTPLRRINETEPLNRMSSYKLGQAMYDAGELHPTALAQELAGGPYLRAGIAMAHLKNRKLIVCDLDNTLWDGVIGDGPVDQHSDRQKAILRLKDKGVLLAVSSKNDPTNVRWNEAVVSPEDFVMMQINWGRKASNIRNIANTLNLNANSFIFLDDRPDERETVMEELPGLLALDPNEPETWKLMEEWSGILGEATLKDRTGMYKERAERQSYLDESDVDADAAYRKLDLRLNLRQATDGDIDRVVDLINRTNQFNTTGIRTTVHEITQPEPRRKIMVATARDKFGDMGIIGVLVVSDPVSPVISHFVLSCRVFGFGVENAMLQSALRSFTDQAMNALLVKTPVNGPCQDVFALNGFMLEGEVWVSQGGRPDTVPNWLTIEDKFCKSPTTQEAA
jgi:FkbH-like protein